VILTISEAAAELGISTAGVRKMVMRREIEPLRRAARPLRFWLMDVADAKARRLGADEDARLDMLAAAWALACDDEAVSR
jgi:hypothetical protein